jgi:hypothetical protein
LIVSVIKPHSIDNLSILESADVRSSTSDNFMQVPTGTTVGLSTLLHEAVCKDTPYFDEVLYKSR